MTRTDIYQAAAQIFRQKGYHAASMQDIADAVQLQKASLYHHVESKQEILLAILDYALDILIADMEAILALDSPPDEKLRQAMDAYIGKLVAEVDLAAVLLLEHRSLAPELCTRHIDRRDRYDSLWRQLIQEGIDQGIFRQVDVTMVSFALLGALSWVITWYQDGGRMTPSEISELYCELFLRGLSVNPGSYS